jgi:hypothetical protein
MPGGGGRTDRRVDWLGLTLLAIPIGVFVLVQALASSSLDPGFFSYYGTFATVAADPVAWLLFALVPGTALMSILAVR